MSIPENFEISNSKIPTNVLLPLQPNNERLEFLSETNKEGKLHSTWKQNYGLGCFEKFIEMLSAL